MKNSYASCFKDRQHAAGSSHSPFHSLDLSVAFPIWTLGGNDEKESESQKENPGPSSRETARKKAGKDSVSSVSEKVGQTPAHLEEP